MVTWRKAVWALAGSSCVIIILQVTCSICGIAFGEAFTFGLFAQKNLYQYQPVPCLFDTPESKSRCPPYYIDINKYDLTNFTFITGASSNHFEEGKDLIASIQQHFPGKIIYYYDLGLDTNQVAEVQLFCNVAYIKWNASIYPKHVRNLTSFAFKSIIIHEALLRFDAVFWLDASGRISPEESRPDWDSVFETARLTDGIIMFDRTGRDTFQCTTRGMYRYLPVDEEKLKRFEMVGAGSLLLYRTESVFNKIVYWWSLCARTADCIQPEGHQVDCEPANPGVSICHRYDQSSLNILVGNYMNYRQNHIPTGQPVIIIRREPTTLYRLKADCKHIHKI